MEAFQDPREYADQPKRSRGAIVTTEPATRLQQAQRCLADTFQLAAQEFTPEEQRALLDCAIERVAREARRAW